MLGTYQSIELKITLTPFQSGHITINDVWLSINDALDCPSLVSALYGTAQKILPTLVSRNIVTTNVTLIFI